MKRLGIWVLMAGLVGSLAVWAGGDCCGKGDKAKNEKNSKGCSKCADCCGKASAECKAVCEKIKANPGTVEACCGKFCASHKGKDGKVTLACHVEKKCCAENYAKTGEEVCSDCAKNAKAVDKEDGCKT